MRVIVDSSDGRFLSAYGEGLVQGATGHELEFFVTGNASETTHSFGLSASISIVQKAFGYQYSVLAPSFSERVLNVFNKCLKV